MATFAESFCLLVRLRSQSTTGASCHSAFVANCFVSFCQPYLPSRWVLILVSCVAKQNKNAGWLYSFIFLILLLIKGMSKGDFLVLPQGFGRLLYVECL